MSYRSARRERYQESQWPAYVPVAERRRRAELAMEKLRKKGHPVAPVKLESKKIATTFWGKAWCDNLEGYADFASRIERGRTYVRNGSVVDLQIAPREVTAMVAGSELYKIKIGIAEVAKPHWSTICRDCAGGIDSLVELLQGRFSSGVMERICRQGDGLFPRPAEITFNCSCPDFAYMCKHVAAVLYGIGARLDQQPELLFRLRAVDENELVARIDASVPLAKGGPAAGKVLDGSDLSALFGLDMDSGGAADAGSADVQADKPVAVVRTKRSGAGGKPVKAKSAAPVKQKAGTVTPNRRDAASQRGAASRVAAPVPVKPAAKSARRGAAGSAPGKAEPVGPATARSSVGASAGPRPRAKARLAGGKPHAAQS